MGVPSGFVVVREMQILLSNVIDFFCFVLKEDIFGIKDFVFETMRCECKLRLCLAALNLGEVLCGSSEIQREVSFTTDNFLSDLVSID